METIRSLKHARLQPRQHLRLGAGLHLKHADRVGLRHHGIDGGIVERELRQVERRAAFLRNQRQRSLIADSIRRPSKSILISPTSSSASLSHCTTTRPGMVAGSVGTRSNSGAPVMTMPPLWMPRCRGSALHLAAQVEKLLPQGASSRSPNSRAVAVTAASWPA